MNPKALLKKAPEYFDDLSDITLFEAQKIKDIYGYQYLLKGAQTKIRGSLHKESYLQDNQFGRYNGDKLILSTESKVNLGAFFENKGSLFAVSEQTSLNKVMDLNHYICYSLYDYYKDFIIDTQDQANRILGANSMRYWLSLKSKIPLIPSRFAPTLSKYIAVDIYSTLTLTTPYKTQDKLIEQSKRDRVKLIAIGLDTNELQEFAYNTMQESSKDFGLLSYLQWSELQTYDKAFDLKANIQVCDLEVNYFLRGTNTQDADKIIKRALFTLTTN